MLKFRKGQTDTMLLIAVGVGAVLVLGILAWFLFRPGLKDIKVGDVTIASIPAEARIIYISQSDRALLEEIYKRYKKIPTFEGIGRTRDAAEADAMRKIAEYLNAVVESYNQLARASLSNIVQKVAGQEKNTAEVLQTEVNKLVTRVMSKAKLIGAKELVVYVMPNGEYHAIYFFDPQSALKVLQENRSALAETAKKFGMESRVLFDEVNKTLEKAFEGTPLEKPMGEQ